MIELKGQDKTRCLALRNEWYSRFLSNGEKWFGNDRQLAESLREEFLAKLGFPSDSVLDLKCGIIFTAEEKRLGINKLHIHG